MNTLMIYTKHWVYKLLWNKKWKYYGLTGLACNGNAHSFLNYPYLEQFLNDFEFINHPNLESEYSLVEIVSSPIPCDILLIEGSV